jgi:hypothetical protein
MGNDRARSDMESGMTFEEATKTLERVSHPFMLIVLERDSAYPSQGRVFLRIAHKCQDSQTMEWCIQNRRCVFLGLDWMDEARFIDYVWSTVRNAHVHEDGEFFKVDGRAIHDPHASQL